MPRAQLLGYLRANYVSGNALVVAAGRMTHRQVVQAVAPYARRLPLGHPARLRRRAQTSNGNPPESVSSPRKTEQTQIALGIRTCSRHDPRRYALRLLNTILGENMSSRLFQVVREDRGLAYSIYSTPSFFERHRTTWSSPPDWIRTTSPDAPAWSCANCAA